MAIPKPANHGCPLLDTDTIYNVRQRKTAPDSSRPRWVHLFRKHIFLRFNRFCWRVMGIEPPEFRDGSWSEGQQAFTNINDARALILAKGPSWYLEPSPLNGCLPDSTCTFDRQEIPKGKTLYANGSKALPTALPRQIATLQRVVGNLSSTLERKAAG